MRYTTALNRNFQFRRMYRSAAYRANSYLVVYYRKSKGTQNRLGITVSKKVGTAVTRNRVRRLMKENYRLLEDQVKQGYDLVIVARVKAAGANFDQICSSMQSLFVACDLMKKTT